MLGTVRLLRRLYRRYRIARLGRDRTTRALMRHHVFSLDTMQHDPELERIHVPVPYSFSSAIKHILILSLMLWWIPTFGQMIAGYVGGRRAGSHWKAVLASLVPVFLIMSLSYIGDHVWADASLANLYSLPGRAMEAVAAGTPEAAPHILFVLDYLRTFVSALQSTVSMGLNGYLVTIIFAYIGGLMGEQSMRELEYERWRPAPTFALPQWALRRTPRWQPARLMPVYEEEEEFEPRPARSVPWVRPALPPPTPAPTPIRSSALKPHRLDREALVQKLVERALRDYEGAA